jgi:hypothetical protein
MKAMLKPIFLTATHYSYAAANILTMTQTSHAETNLPPQPIPAMLKRIVLTTIHVTQLCDWAETEQRQIFQLFVLCS